MPSWPARHGASAHTGLGQGDFRDPWLLERFADLDAAARAWDAAAWTEIYLAAGLAGPYRTLADLDPDVVARCRQMITDMLVTHIAPGPAPTPSPVADAPERIGKIDVPLLGSPARSTHPTISAWCTSSSTMRSRGRPSQPSTAPRTCRTLERPTEFDALLRGFVDALPA